MPVVRERNILDDLVERCLSCFRRYPSAATLAGATTSAELCTSAADGYGLFEARLRFASGDGVIRGQTRIWDGKPALCSLLSSCIR